jgi:hypothetical protein
MNNWTWRNAYGWLLLYGYIGFGGSYIDFTALGTISGKHRYKKKKNN